MLPKTKEKTSVQKEIRQPWRILICPKPAGSSAKKISGCRNTIPGSCPPKQKMAKMDYSEQKRTKQTKRRFCQEGTGEIQRKIFERQNPWKSRPGRRKVSKTFRITPKCAQAYINDRNQYVQITEKPHFRPEKTGTDTNKDFSKNAAFLAKNKLRSAKKQR